MQKILFFFTYFLFVTTVSLAQQPDREIFKYSNNEIGIGFNNSQDRLLIMKPGYSDGTATVSEIILPPEKVVAIYTDPILEEMFLYFDSNSTKIIRYELDESQNIVGEKEQYSTDRLWFSLLNLGEENIKNLQEAFVKFFKGFGTQLEVLDKKIN